MLPVGSQFGKYKIEELIGSGGSGTVYRAMDPDLSRTVALKVIKAELAKSTSYRERLADEAKTAARIDSANVVKVWEYAELDNQPYISLEYIAGAELREACQKCDFSRKVEMALQIAEGLTAAHTQGLIHRDLKPENIKVTEDGRVKIFDFGLAKTVQTDSVSPDGTIEGTLHYLSPEQLSGEPLTLQSDIFSYGIVLFELFTGERPFEGDYSASIIYSILHESPPAPSEINEELPEWIDQLILKLLAKSPQDRYENIDLVIAYLKTSLQGQEVKITDKVAPTRQSVTVIDLKNLSGDESWDYFCIGFTEDVIKELSRRTDLVISAEPSTTSSPRNIRETFERFHSDYVMVGSLMKWQDSIRLNMSVYGEQGDQLVFGENYEGNSKNLFELLTRAAQEISEALAETTGSSSIEVADTRPADVTAYDYYLKGKSYYYNNTPEDHEFAIQMFERALENDARFALAHSGLADVYTTQYMSYYDRTHERIAKAKTEALNAISIDPKLPEAHRALGRYCMNTGDFVGAEKSFLMAVEYDPNYSAGFMSLAWLKEFEGDYDQSMKYARKSLELSPCHLETHLLLSLINMDQKKYTLAMATLQRAIELGPDYGRAHYNLGAVYVKLGVFDLALDNFQTAIKFLGDPNCYIDAGYICLIQKNYDDARTYFRQSLDAGFLPFVAHYYYGYLEQEVGNIDEARKHFENVVESGNEYAKNEPDNIHVMSFSASAHVFLGDLDAANGLLQKLTTHTDLNGEVLYFMARAYAAMGDIATTKAILDRALTEHAGPTEREVQADPHFALLKD
jgi:serine/threonine protein kinase/Flp pilus assembly protein TadD